MCKFFPDRHRTVARIPAGGVYDSRCIAAWLGLVLVGLNQLALRVPFPFWRNRMEQPWLRQSLFDSSLDDFNVCWFFLYQDAPPSGFDCGYSGCATASAVIKHRVAFVGVGLYQILE